jgi:hypothetical protein
MKFRNKRKFRCVIPAHFKHWVEHYLLDTRNELEIYLVSWKVIYDATYVLSNRRRCGSIQQRMSRIDSATKGNVANITSNCHIYMSKNKKNSYRDFCLYMMDVELLYYFRFFLPKCCAYCSSLWCPFHPPRFYHPNNIQWITCWKLWIHLLCSFYILLLLLA